MTPAGRVVGVDESGKGDYFGPLVIASLLADESDTGLLQSIGVRDGKTLSPKRIMELDDRIREDFPHAVIVISPSQYNQLHKETRNLNVMLAEGHARAIDELVREHPADMAISDKFGKTELIENALRRKGQEIRLEQIVRGESIIQVAAASILARARFMNEMDALSNELDFELPRGAAAHVDEAGRKLVRKFGPEILLKIAKVHFKNTQRVGNLSLFSK
jgi:ribonuclease HIII